MSNSPPPADDPIARATEIVTRALERGGRPATPLELAEAAVAQAYLDHDKVVVSQNREPCYRCRCCKGWRTALELVRAHVLRHQAQLEEDDERASMCGHDDCLVCAEPPTLQ